MKKFLIFLVIILAAALCAAITCPDQEAHNKALKEAVKEAVDDISEEQNTAFNKLANAIGEGVSNLIIDNSLNVTSYTVFSIGEITVGKEVKKVSFGIYGHVFTVPSDQIINKNK